MNENATFRPTHLFCCDLDLSCFTQYGTEINFAKNHSILLSGQTPQFCYYVKSGRVIKYGATALGDEIIYDCYGEGALLFELEAPMQTPIKTAYKALRDSCLLQIPPDRIMKEIETNPASLRTFMRYLAIVRHHSFRQAREANSQSIDWRVCKLLLTYADRDGTEYDGKILITEKISQDLIAKMLGVSRVSVVRAFRELRDMGLMEQINGYYCIRSIGQLQRHMQRIDNLLY